MDYSFVRFFTLGLGFGLDCSWFIRRLCQSLAAASLGTAAVDRFQNLKRFYFLKVCSDGVLFICFYGFCL